MTSPGDSLGPPERSDRKKSGFRPKLITIKRLVAGDVTGTVAGIVSGIAAAAMCPIPGRINAMAGLWIGLAIQLLLALNIASCAAAGLLSSMFHRTYAVGTEVIAVSIAIVFLVLVNDPIARRFPPFTIAGLTMYFIAGHYVRVWIRPRTR